VAPRFERRRDFGPRSGASTAFFDESGRLEHVNDGTGTYDADGNLLRRMLEQAEIIDGLVCARGFVGFRDGRVSVAILAAALSTPIGVFPAGSCVRELGEDGLPGVVVVADPCRIRGVDYAAGSVVVVSPREGRVLVVEVSSDPAKPGSR
jgi:hypothetical protein